jgi:maltooligosyltrehalose trehalohydrolase
MLLAPGTPMLFQGQEFGASTPFFYFADHKPELGCKIADGRKEFLAQWRTLRSAEMQRVFADPCSAETFARSRLDHSELNRHAEIYRLHCDLLRLRKEDPVISRQGQDGIDGAVLSQNCFIARFFGGPASEDRLLVVNLGTEFAFSPSPEPLLGPPEGLAWQTLWSSEDPQYGGNGAAALDSDENWRIPGCAAVLLVAQPPAK